MSGPDATLLRRVEWCTWRLRGSMDVGPSELRSLCAAVREGTASGAPPAPALLAALEGLSVALAWARESLERELAAIGPRRRAMHRFAVLQGRPGRRLSARA